jgi:hypothetical protein
MPDIDALLQAADQVPERFDALKGRLGKAPLMRWDDYPDVTLHKLEVMARSAYLAGTYLVRNPDVAYRAEDLTRAVLECLAHVTFIAGLPPLAYKRGPSERALCVELGMVKGLHDLLKKLPDEALMQDPSVREVVAADEQAIRTLHAATGCKCTGRGEGNVGPTLRDAAAAVGSPWTTLVGVYASASTLMHQALLNRLVREVEPGITDWVPADAEHRIRLLTWLVIAYSQIVEQILYLHDPSLGAEFRELPHEILREAGSVAPMDVSPGGPGLQ